MYQSRHWPALPASLGTCGYSLLSQHPWVPVTPSSSPSIPPYLWLPPPPLTPPMTLNLSLPRAGFFLPVPKAPQPDLYITQPFWGYTDLLTGHTSWLAASLLLSPPPRPLWPMFILDSSLCLLSTLKISAYFRHSHVLLHLFHFFVQLLTSLYRQGNGGRRVVRKSHGEEQKKR